jgi:N-methylhydantoinase B
VLQQDLMDLVLLNCQVPKERINDFRAQMAANRLGVQRFQALCAKYGTPTMLASCAGLLDYSERRMRAGIARIPDGVYRFEDRLDTDGVRRAVDLRLAIEVRGDEMHFDFAGNRRRSAGRSTQVMTALLATLYYIVKAIVDPEIPPNSGLAGRCMSARRSARSSTRSRRPRSTAAPRSASASPTLVLGALAPACRARAGPARAAA